MTNMNDASSQWETRQTRVFFETVAMYEALDETAQQTIAELQQHVVANRVESQRAEDALREEIRSRDAMISGLQGTVREFESSASWQVTRPLRALVRMLRRVARR